VVGNMDLAKGYIYILQSEKNNTYYVGSTKDVKKRFLQHQNGYVIYTRHLRPLILKFYQQVETLALARRIEYKIKKLKRKDILDHIVRDQIIKLDY
jgi:putative endonuclease